MFVSIEDVGGRCAIGVVLCAPTAQRFPETTIDGGFSGGVARHGWGAPGMETRYHRQSGANASACGHSKELHLPRRPELRNLTRSR